MSLDEDLRAAADRIKDCESVTVVSHIDADGIASESILVQAIIRQGIPVTSVFLRQLEPLMMHLIPDSTSLKLFVDFGAGQQQLLAERGYGERDILIIDHHVSQPCGCHFQEFNCLPHGYTKLSAAGLSYLVARELDPSNRDLAPLAVVGNVGDMMAREDCRLSGPARDIVNDGAATGDIAVIERDLNAYGTSTRPLHICLAYMDDPYIPGISNNQAGALKFLQKLGITLQDEQRRWIVWEEIPPDDRRTITSALVQQLIAHGRPVTRLFAESYIFTGERRRSPLRNATEYATLLNACGRWARPATGGAICRGDRAGAYREAEQMLTNHRAKIRELLEYIIDTGVEELSHLQHIHVGGRYPDTIVGIGAGMALSRLNWRKPILIMCEVPEDPALTKVSMRTSERVVAQGVDLQLAMATASAECGGAGGGHRIAAGAFIPRDSEREFVERVNTILAGQYAQKSPGHR